MTGELYYHAGAGMDATSIYWSYRTHETRAEAIKEAHEMVAEGWGRPVIEWWDRAHGKYPGDCEAVSGEEWL